jgi:hypothetical protein
MTFRDQFSERTAILTRLLTEGVDLGLQRLSVNAERIVHLLKVDDFVPGLLGKDGIDGAVAVQRAVDEATLEIEEEQKESARITYRIQLERFYRHHPDPDDRPDPPPPLPGWTGLRDLIEIRYRALCKLALVQRQVGAWPFVVGDLLDEADGKNALLIDSAQNLLARHPDTPDIVAASTDESMVRLARNYRETATSLKAREQREREKALRERERFVRDLEGRGERLEGAEKFIDRFDRNRDVISRLC